MFAHEYHHKAWGHHWFVLQGGQGVEGTLLEMMIIEGQADLFAENLFPDLKPQWNQPFAEEVEAALWNRLQPALASTDQQEHGLYLFGNESEGLPWCVGYSFGRVIVADYLSKHPDLSFSGLIKVAPKAIFAGSRFNK